MISVIIPTCNRNDLLIQCLAQLAPSVQTLDSYYEVIVTDDGKTNQAKSLIVDNFTWAKWVEGPKKGPAANRNNGSKQASGEWLVFIDDDCLPNNDILRQYTNSALKSPNTLVFEGSITAERPQRSFIEESPLNESGGYLWSCNFMIEKKLFINTLNGFDEQFPYAAMEDVELHYRLKQKSINILFLKDASVVHPWRKQKDIFQITLQRFKSTLYFLKKHPEMRANINSLFYLRSFYNGLIKNTFKLSIRYHFRGIFHKLTYDFMNLYFAFYFIFNK